VFTSAEWDQLRHEGSLPLPSQETAGVPILDQRRGNNSSGALVRVPISRHWAAHHVGEVERLHLPFPTPRARTWSNDPISPRISRRGASSSGNMCLLLIAFDSHPDYTLIVAANRDEFYDRPSTAAAFWADAPWVVGGRDLKAGGTWLGIDRCGRFA